MNQLRELIAQYGDRYSTATIYVIFTLISLFVAAILFGILHSTGVVKLILTGAVKEAEFGGAFAGFIITLIFLIRSYNQASTSTKLTIRGNVSSADNNPIEGAMVFIVGTGSNITTNNTGWFAIEVDEQKSWVVRAIYKGKATQATITRKDLQQPISLVISEVPHAPPSRDPIPHP